MKQMSWCRAAGWRRLFCAQANVGLTLVGKVTVHKHQGGSGRKRADNAMAQTLPQAPVTARSLQLLRASGQYAGLMLVVVATYFVLYFHRVTTIPVHEAFGLCMVVVVAIHIWFFRAIFGFIAQQNAPAARTKDPQKLLPGKTRRLPGRRHGKKAAVFRHAAGHFHIR